MARINLLPWRAERRKQRQKEFLSMLGVTALAAVVLSILIISYYNAQISGQEDRNAYMRDQITQVDAKIKQIEELDKKKAKLLARKEVIEQLQANRSQMVHLFDSLVRTIPDGVVLTAIKQSDKTLTLTGRAQSNARVSTYMRSLEGSGWMTKPELSVIEAKAGDPGLPYTYTLSVTLANPNAPTDTDGDGIPDTPANAVSVDGAPIADGQAGEQMTAPADTAAPAPEQAAPESASPEQAAPEEAAPEPDDSTDDADPASTEPGASEKGGAAS